MHLYKLVFLCVIFTLCFLVKTPLLAQSDVDRAVDQINEERRQNTQQKRLELEEHNRQKVKRPLVQEEPPKDIKTISDNSNGCLDVKGINVEGVKRFKPKVIDAIKRGFEGKCLTLATLNQLLNLYTQLYAQKGYITARAYLPEQDVGDGYLDITIVEGELVSIEINGEAASPIDVVTLFPGMKGKILNLRDIEQGLDQLNRLPSNEAKMEMRPGDDVGGTVLELNVKKQKPWRLSYQIDNMGSSLSGRYKSKLNLALDGVLGLNEGINLSYDRSMNNNPWYINSTRPYGNKYNGRFSIPFGYWTLSLDGSYSNYQSSIDGLTGTIPTEGSTVSASTTLSHLLARDQTSKSVVDLVVNYSKAKNYISGSLVESTSRAFSNIKLTLLHSFQIFQGSASMSISAHKGLDWFGAVKDENLPDASPKAQFDKISFSASYHKPINFLGLNLSFDSSLSGQVSEDLLFGDEQLSLGGYSSVRGAETSLLHGNMGILLRSELALKFDTKNLGHTAHNFLGTIEPYMALDWGRIANQSSYDIEGGSVSGLTFGVRSRHGHFIFDMAYADLVDVPNRMSSELDKDGVVYATMSLNF